MKTKETTHKWHPSTYHYFSVLIKSTGNSIGERGATSFSDALKSNTTLTQLCLCCEDKRNNTQMASINNQLFSIFIKTTDNKIGETGATSLSDVLKSNTTLTQLSLRSGRKRNDTQTTSINNTLFAVLIKSTGNDIGERGATSLSDALKSNTTLTQLCLCCEDKRINTQMASIYNQLFSIFIKTTDNKIGETGATSLSDALKTNTTLIELNLRGENKKKQHKSHPSITHSFPFSSNKQSA